MTKKHPKFPRQIARFLHLQGGQYGTALLIARTDDSLELQLGGDFVQFSREQAEDLREAVQKFLDFERSETEEEEEREVERALEAAEETAEREPESEPPRPTRRKRPRANP